MSSPCLVKPAPHAGPPILSNLFAKVNAALAVPGHKPFYAFLLWWWHTFCKFQAYWCKPPGFGILHMPQARVLIGCRLQVSEVQVLYSLGGLHAQRVIGPHHQSFQTAEVSCSLHAQEKNLVSLYVKTCELKMLFQPRCRPNQYKRLSSPYANLCNKEGFPAQVQTCAVIRLSSPHAGLCSRKALQPRCRPMQ